MGALSHLNLDNLNFLTWSTKRTCIKNTERVWPVLELAAVVVKRDSSPGQQRAVSGENTGVGARELLVIAFLSVDHYFTSFLYVCFSLKTPYLM